MIRFFWRHFFSILLVFVALAQWACTAWLASQLLGIQLHWLTHLVLPPTIYMANRALLLRPVPAKGSARVAVKAYTALAFASIFGLVFLLLTAAAFGTAWMGLQVTGVFGVLISQQGLITTRDLVATYGLLIVGGAIGYGYLFGQRRVVVNAFDAGLSNLDRGGNGLRVVQISDIHLGHNMTASRVAHYVERINRLEPDIVCITGDITDGLDHSHETFPALGGIRARLGVFAILGNHDHYAGPDDVEHALRTHTGFTVLRDSVATVRDNGQTLHIVGLDDRGLDWARGVPEHPELERVLSGIPPDEPRILLSHRPDLFEHAARLGVELILAGHTHGGQLALPWPGGRRPSLAHFMTRYPRGTFQDGESLLHVNLGLGVTGQPVRLATPREITLLTLRHKENNDNVSKV